MSRDLKLACRIVLIMPWPLYVDLLLGHAVSRKEGAVAFAGDRAP